MGDKSTKKAPAKGGKSKAPAKANKNKSSAIPTAKGKPSKAPSKGKGKGAPTKSGTKPSKTKAEPKKRKRVKADPARPPCPSAGGRPNPLLISKNLKRALCIAFAHELGGATSDNGKKDDLLILCVRETGVLWKTGLTLENCVEPPPDHEHLNNAEQNGRGYAMNCGRKRHDQYMQKFPDKVGAVMPFAKALLKSLRKGAESYEADRVEAIKDLPKLRNDILQAKADADAKKGKGKK